MVNLVFFLYQIGSMGCFGIEVEWSRKEPLVRWAPSPVISKVKITPLKKGDDNRKETHFISKAIYRGYSSIYKW